MVPLIFLALYSPAFFHWGGKKKGRLILVKSIKLVQNCNLALEKTISSKPFDIGLLTLTFPVPIHSVILVFLSHIHITAAIMLSGGV